MTPADEGATGFTLELRLGGFTHLTEPGDAHTVGSTATHKKAVPTGRREGCSRPGDRVAEMYLGRVGLG
jgi:hypothetical protein